MQMDTKHSSKIKYFISALAVTALIAYLSLVNLRHLLSDEWVLLEFLSMVVVAGVRWCSLDVQ